MESETTTRYVAVTPKPLPDGHGFWHPANPADYLDPRENPNWFNAYALQMLRDCYHCTGDYTFEAPGFRHRVVENLERAELIEVWQVRIVDEKIYRRIYTCTDLGRAIVELGGPDYWNLVIDATPPTETE